MRILIYIEPQLEMDLPTHKENWLVDWVPRLADGIRCGFSDGVRIVAIAANHLVEAAPAIEGVEWVGVHQRDVVELKREDALAGRIARFTSCGRGPESRRQAERIAALLPGFVPDCVLALSDARFLQEIYPAAAIVQHEYGLFSRSPFPESFFFDPVGPTGVAWLGRYWRSVVDEWQPSEEEQRVTADFVDAYRTAIEISNPFDAEIATVRTRFARLALLPLQVSGHALYDGFTEVRSPLQLSEAALDALPEGMGLIVTAHPGGRTLDEQSKAYLRARHSAFLMPQGDRWHAAPSQYLVPACDTVVCVSSSVAALTLFWGNAFVAAGQGYLDFLAASDWSAPWPSRAKLDKVQRYRLLAWLLFRFLWTDEDVRDGAQMRALINTAIAVRRDSRYDNFYDRLPARSADRVLRGWVETVEYNGRAARFARDVERFALGVNTNDGALWRPLEADLETTAAKMPLSRIRASFYFHQGMAAINGKGDRSTAADFFARARDDYAALCAARPDDHLSAMYWHSAFHLPYALKGIGRDDAFRSSFLKLVCDPPRGAGPMPAETAARLGELAG